MRQEKKLPPFRAILGAAPGPGIKAPTECITESLIDFRDVEGRDGSEVSL